MKISKSQKYLNVMYAGWARVYDSIIDPLFSFDRQEVINTLRIKESENILEVKSLNPDISKTYLPK